MTMRKLENYIENWGLKEQMSGQYIIKIKKKYFKYSNFNALKK